MMKLALRNLIAHWGILALSDPAREGGLRALAAFAERADAFGVAPLEGARSEWLESMEEVFEVEAGSVRLCADMIADLPALRESTRRFVDILEHRPCGPAPFDWEQYHHLPAADAAPPTAPELRWTLCAAGRLFDQRLFFEVHEVIEPCWLRSQGCSKEFLKGLIQVAVGLHHHGNGNLRGARKLLSAGAGYLKRFRPRREGVELTRFCLALEDCIEQIRRQEQAAWAPLNRLPEFQFSD